MPDVDQYRSLSRASALAWGVRQARPFTYATARRSGLTRAVICGLVDSRQWVQLRRGVFCDAGLAGRADPTWLRAAAALLVMAPGAVVSHQTAAALYDLPVPEASRAYIWLTRPATSRHGRHRQPGIIERSASLPPGHRATLLGLPVTTAARTVVDLARHLPPVDALVVADAALHQQRVTAAEVELVRFACASWPGIGGAAHVLRLADGAAASPLESRSRVAFLDGGLPTPVLQAAIHLPTGGVAFADFLWEEWRVIGEADGRLKYERPEDLWREKLREDRLRELGYEIVRWTWDDIVNRPDVVIGRILRAAARRRSLS